MDEATVSLLLKILGERFVAYVDGLSLEELEAHPGSSGEAILSLSEEIFGELAGFVVRLPVSDDGLATGLQVSQWLGQFDANINTTRANCMRIKAGSDLWNPSGHDLFEDLLLIQLRDTYPLMLLPIGISPFDMPIQRLSGPLYLHPKRLDFEQAMMDDSILAKLFPDEHKGMGRTGTVYSTAGRGGGIQLQGFAAHLISVGWEWARLSNSEPTIEEHAAGTLEVLRTIKSAIQRQAAVVPVRIGITGVLLPDGCGEVDLGWGRIRPADDRDENFLVNRMMDGSLQSDQDGETVTINYRGDVVLETNIPYRLRLKEVNITGGWPQDLDPNPLIDQRLENLRLGLLLSSNTRPAAQVVSSWSRILDPLHVVSVLGWHDTRTVRGLVARRLTEEEVRAWKEWAVIIGERRQSSVDVAVRRALLATTERTMPEDMLVDAVVVWENLFGAKQESTLRVTGSLAWLLGEGSEDRKAKRQLYGKLYELRSRIVHGGRPLKPEEARTQPQEAVAIALEALRVVFRDRPDLLVEDGSEARSNRLMLDA